MRRPRPAMHEPQHISLDDPVPFLSWIAAHGEDAFRLDAPTFVQPWGLVALATLARADGANPLRVERKSDAKSPVRFAHALGFDDVVAGSAGRRAAEPGRTVKMRRFTQAKDIEPLSEEAAKLLLPRTDDAESRKTVQYVLVELLRNVVQHSGDALGGVAVAQRERERDAEGRFAVQIAVCDSGIGVPASLARFHKIEGPQHAIERALWPHVSGAFAPEFTGSSENAGMGLFFIAEMTKLTAGRLFIASRGAALVLRGDASGTGAHEMRFLKPDGVGFPGTLVVMELPTEVRDYDALIETIQKRAQERVPQRVQKGWVVYADPGPDAPRFAVKKESENAVAARTFADAHLLPRIMKGEPFVLDFSGIEVCTQSFLHALLFDALRLAWARRSKIHVLNAAPAVRSTLALLESYALGG